MPLRRRMTQVSGSNTTGAQRPAKALAQPYDAALAQAPQTRSGPCSPAKGRKQRKRRPMQRLEGTQSNRKGSLHRDPFFSLWAVRMNCSHGLRNRKLFLKKRRAFSMAESGSSDDFPGRIFSFFGPVFSLFGPVFRPSFFVFDPVFGPSFFVFDPVFRPSFFVFDPVFRPCFFAFRPCFSAEFFRFLTLFFDPVFCP